jgi:hypothetical protein
MTDHDPLPERYDAPPHDPSWELEPRWSAEDRARCEARKALLNAPGLASAKSADADRASRGAEKKKTGSE